MGLQIHMQLIRSNFRVEDSADSNKGLKSCLRLRGFHTLDLGASTCEHNDCLADLGILLVRLLACCNEPAENACSACESGCSASDAH